MNGFEFITSKYRSKDVIMYDKIKSIFERKIDPRTKILLSITVTTLLMGDGFGVGMKFIQPIAAIIPFGLFILYGKYVAGFKYLVIYYMSFLIQKTFIVNSEGIFAFMILGTVGIITRMLPAYAIGYITFSTTKVNEFTAAMKKIHVSEKLIIPIAVLFRFFPTLKEEFNYINSAMKMRGLAGLEIIKSPLKAIEYRLIPLLMCTVKIGEELSIASLTRGLGGLVKRTNICKISFGVWDILYFMVSVICWVLFFI